SIDSPIERSRQAASLRHAFKLRQGFTLVELLVVMAVIGLLLAILSPAVMQARAAARRTQCQSQMRQIGMAMTNYVDIQGSRGVFPFCPILPSLAPDRPPLQTALGPFIEQNEIVFACPDDRDYFAKEGLSYEYPATRLQGKNMLQVRRKGGSS